MKSSTHVLYILLVLCLSLVNKSRFLQKPPKVKWFPNDISCQFDIIWSCLLDFLPCSMGKYGEAWPWIHKNLIAPRCCKVAPCDAMVPASSSNFHSKMVWWNPTRQFQILHLPFSPKILKAHLLHRSILLSGGPFYPTGTSVNLRRCQRVSSPEVAWAGWHRVTGLTTWM